MWYMVLVYRLQFSVRDNPTNEIPSLPGQKRHNVEEVVKFLNPYVDKGLQAVLLFGISESLQKVWFLYMPIV